MRYYIGEILSQLFEGGGGSQQHVYKENAVDLNNQEENCAKARPSNFLALRSVSLSMTFSCFILHSMLDFTITVSSVKFAQFWMMKKIASNPRCHKSHGGDGCMFSDLASGNV